ncbi:protein-disulfide reductase DsbD family protein [Eionea flava]
MNLSQSPILTPGANNIKNTDKRGSIATLFTIIAATVCFLLSITHQAQAQSTPLFSSNTTDNPFSNPFAGSTEEFLHVDEAYQLSVRATKDHIIAQWIVADHYFLYGEQFRLSINGQAVEATRAAGEISYDEIFEKDVEKYYVYTESIIDRKALTQSLGGVPHPNDIPLTLSVTYQGCADAGLCYPPETKSFTIEGTYAQKSSVQQSSAQKALNAPAIQTSTENNNDSITLTALMLLFAIGGGVILNLMPCVFPVLSIKALSIASHTDTRSRIEHGWSYTAGCVLTFIAVAATLLAIRSAGQAVGWGFQLQSPAVITFLSLLFFIMGLSLAGHIQLGNRWMGLGQSLTQGNKRSHSFFTGVLAAVVASPCTAPFMATALGYALTQPTSTALLIFAGLGFGMALPFLLLSHIPQLSRILPKPGQWMDTFKQAIAFPLYLTSLWLLWVLGQQIGINGVITTLLGGLLILFSLWLCHIGAGKRHSRFNTVILLLCGITLASIIWQNSDAPNDNAQPSTSHTLWQPYTPETLAQLRDNNATVFVNLTADWCITCKWNEKRVFTSQTLEAMKNKGIYLLEGDWTRYNKDITALLDEYGRGGVPLYLLFRGDTSTRAMILPQILNPTEFEQLLSQL